MIKAILMDCDGVLTNGTYYYTKDGKTMKLFSSIDSKGIKQAQSRNIRLSVISEDPTGFEITKSRCDDMQILVYQASNAEDKLSLARELCGNWGISLAECAFIGDDIGDLHILGEVGMPIAVANATKEIKDLVHRREGYITNMAGGHGAVREAIEWILAYNQGK
jgi:YrbI family 3-deoxy-D-manno-octulosonate 8-phosphate phosphatase